MGYPRTMPPPFHKIFDLSARIQPKDPRRGACAPPSFTIMSSVPFSNALIVVIASTGSVCVSKSAFHAGRNVMLSSHVSGGAGSGCSMIAAGMLARIPFQSMGTHAEVALRVGKPLVYKLRFFTMAVYCFDRWPSCS